MKMQYKYWKVICRYGHVGRRKDISISRYLETENNFNLIDVLNIVSTMPGVKKKSIFSIVSAELITKEQYDKGKEEEKENFYLQKLMSYETRNNENTLK
ncbi:hypothetical protein [Aquibacillus rhizosphaerae]|uniref:Uncharacterized protein n=1 Tax=Aquibacillus rhizosphaerae TaxID=3051431 RepID=A0ABT7L1N1_9BACI|nr:hypothetical protein [Aquibacillus sp. LR5S19]MDL4839753.1 hypothetical protein [Aquibacillus sp. LR5S19]